MVRTVLWILYFIIGLILTIPSLLRVKSLDKQGRIEERDQLTHRVMKNLARRYVQLSGSQVKVIGEENLPKEGSVLFVSNHQGNFDILIFVGYIMKPKGFIAKIELSKFPILNTWMYYQQCVFIDRKDVRQSLKAINQGAEKLKEGYSLVIFPEGTRSEDGTLGEFKPGSLKLAAKAGVPIVPVTIKGSHKIMPKGKLTIHPTQVEVIISPPIPGAEAKESNELTEKIRTIIEENLKK